MSSEELVDDATEEQPIELEDSGDSVEEAVVEEVIEPTIEDKAKAQGWRAKEAFDGSSEEFVGAGEFLRRGELFSKISSQNKKIRDLEETFRDISSHMEKSDKLAYDKALRQLKVERTEAVESGDTEKFTKLDEEFQELKSNKPDYNTKEKLEELPEEVLEFKNKHSWFGGTSVEDKIMTQAAIELSNDVIAKKPGATPKDEIRLVEQGIMRMFPHKFKNSNRKAPAAVTSSTTSSVKKSGPKDWDKLTDHQKQCAKRFSRQIEGYSIEDYIKDLKALGEVK